MNEYQRLENMKEIKETKEPDVVYYDPHHGIYRQEKPTIKLRAVYNCFAMTTNVTSLNA